MDVRGEELKESEGSKTSDLEKEYRVTPWEVEGVVDYNKIVEEFGTRLITPEIIAKLQRFSRSISKRHSDPGYYFRLQMTKNFSIANILAYKMWRNTLTTISLT